MRLLLNYTSRATFEAKQAAEIMWGEKIKFLHTKNNISRNLYFLYNDAVDIYGRNWAIIENQLHSKSKPAMELNYSYNTINKST